eukprot:CAMPEP_0176044782 /NCGR_PEP_ID=MMETSP0120_2-20121206/22227_1 /TAXON_ID=160619 /ORGANISM="Kryptoperidinium foliaceum, Strain CCMP 1326" /LENGTH=631 /DNA_ID=CAMNT_0017378187 /DNA_START=53 /DNA_END=1948 /DNA_ORIENTATION=-
MGGASSYTTILYLTLYLIAVWGAAKVSRVIGISSIVLEITTGVVLGPEVLNFLPEEYAQCHHKQVIDCKSRKDLERIARLDTEYCDLGAYVRAGKYSFGPWETGFWGSESATVTLGSNTYRLDAGKADRNLAAEDASVEDGLVEEASGAGSRRLAGPPAAIYPNYAVCLAMGCAKDLAHECAETPDILTVIGHAGVAMMIFESGMHFDFQRARAVGLPACAVALVGTVLPLASGTLVVMGFGFTFFEGFAAGTALAPTSVGIALRLLHEAKSLNSYFGQAIITAAFVDDILSLILYNVLFSLSGDMSFMTFLPLILGVIFMMLAAAAGARLWPRVIEYGFSKIRERKPDAKLTTHHELLFGLMLVVLLLYAQLTYLCGTHLWGCFIAGMSFAMWKEAHHVWVRQTKRITCWMIRIFFAASVAFAIPVQELLSLEAFWKGAIMGIGPCIIAKVICAPFMGDARFVIGWAMVGRAEFAYLIAQMASVSGMMRPAVFSIVIWALLWATVLAPCIFRVVLSRYLKSLDEELVAGEGDAEQPKEGEEPRRAMPHSLTLGHMPDLLEEEVRAQQKLDQQHYSELEIENARLRAKLEEFESHHVEWQEAIEKLQEVTGRSPSATSRSAGSADKLGFVL